MATGGLMLAGAVTVAIYKHRRSRTPARAVTPVDDDDDDGGFAGGSRKRGGRIPMNDPDELGGGATVVDGELD